MGFTLDLKGIDVLGQYLESKDEEALRAIQSVLDEEAPELIKEQIQRLLPASGRKWRRKKKAASLAQPFTHETNMLSLTVKSKGGYHYLYFPDDGSNTKRHYGGQNFMERGAEAAVPDIIDRVLGRLGNM